MGHGQNFLVISLFRQGLAFHWAADLLHFPGLWSCVVHPFCPQE
jgi:hypothetical protein